MATTKWQQPSGNNQAATTKRQQPSGNNQAATTKRQQPSGNALALPFRQLISICLMAATGIAALLIQPLSMLHAARTIPLNVTYNCVGLPWDGATSSNVCHSLAISRNAYNSDIPTTLFGGGAQMQLSTSGTEPNPSSYNNQWLTNEVKLADNGGNWVEGGTFTGWLGTAGYFEYYYWSDSRPQDVNSANYHFLDPINGIYLNGNYSLQIDIVRSKTQTNVWYLTLVAPGGATYRETSTATNLSYPVMSPTTIQMGTFLIGTDGLYASATRFASRYYVNGSFQNVNLYHEYHIFVDQPPYMFHPVAGDTDFSTYCCNYLSYYGTLQTGGYSLRKRFPLNSLDTMQSLDSSTPSQPSELGVPAIRGSKNEQTATKTTPIQASEVVAYVQGNVMPFTIAPKGNPTVMNARLLSSKQISILLKGETTDFSDSKMLWLVEVSGTFNFPNAKGAKDSCHHGYEVFDPTTGNLLMLGGMS